MYDWAEFRHFRYVLAILENRGLRGAAEELNTSQPNLSIQARQFQENAGICLYRRSRQGTIRATATGAAFIGLARHLLEVRDEVIEALAAIDRGELTSICCASSSLVDQQLFRELCSLQKRLIPAAKIRPTHGDIPQLVEEIVAGVVDIALVTLPVTHPDLHLEPIRRDRLVACVRKDSPLAQKGALVIGDLQTHLRVFYHPQRHPDAHDRLLEWLTAAGVRIREYSRASHPSEMQAFVRDGFGVALVREGMILEPELTTRPVLGVDWTMETALVYRKLQHSKIVPILARQFRKNFGTPTPDDNEAHISSASAFSKRPNAEAIQRPEEPVQLRLLG